MVPIATIFFTAEARRLYDVCIHEVVIKKNGAFIDGIASNTINRSRQVKNHIGFNLIEE